jgi:serine/threonine protein kinase
MADARIGPYQILRLINRGGQGSVYLGFDKRLRRRVAIKIYTLPGLRSVRRRCLDEAQLLAGIQSPKVVQIHDLIESREHLAMVMEYVPGCDLHEFLCQVRPSLASAVTVGTDMAAALAVARQQRIVHRDLKASNVLITAQGRAKLSDFGIARLADAGVGEDFAGSWSALSPEQYRGERLDVRSDLFALGCLLYRMLTGLHPFFRGGTPDPGKLLERPAQPVSALIPPYMEVPEEMTKLVDSMVQLDPGSRPPNTHQVRSALRNVFRQLPLAATTSLLEEASPCFREETSEELPPQVPRELVREGRSRLVAGGGFRTASWRDWLPVSRRSRFVVAVLFVFVLGLSITLLWPRSSTRIWIEEMGIQVHTQTGLPAGLSSGWLVQQTVDEISQAVGSLDLYGPGAPRRRLQIYRPGAPEPETDEQLQMSLNCTPAMCIYQVSRYMGMTSRHEQAVLLSGTPLNRWREVVRQTVARMYP